MKAVILIEKSDAYYERDWYIKIKIDCQSTYELKQVILKLEEITKTLIRGER